MNPIATPPRASLSGNCLLAAIAMLALASLSPAENRGGIEWIANDLDRATQEAAAMKRPVVLYFYNDRARHCQTIEEQTFSDSRVSKAAERFVRVAINEESRRDLAARFSLMKVPTVIILDHNMDEIDRAIGMKSPEAILAYFDRTDADSTVTGSGGSTGGALPAARFDTAAVDVRTPRPGTIPVNVTVEVRDSQKVYLVGDFCDWREQAIPMVRMGSSRWSATLHLDPGTYEYRLLADGLRWNYDQANPLRRANSYSDFNSVLVVGDHTPSPVVTGRTVRFSFYDAAAKRVAVAGSFTDWKQVEMFRHPTEKGLWGAKFDGVAAGEHEYKFVVDDRWINDPDNLTPVKVQSYINNTFTVK